jgi:ribulose bisphosphate carboxylase small subunit
MQNVVDLKHKKDRPLSDQALEWINHCVRKNCIIRIEHTQHVAQRTTWHPCCDAFMHDGNTARVIHQLRECVTHHAEQHIRLTIEDISCGSRIVFPIHTPQQLAHSS